MAEEIKKTEEKATEATPKEASASAAKKKTAAKKETVQAEKVNEAKKNFGKAQKHDYEVILEPVITEKSMGFLQNTNKVTVRVCASANKIEIKEAFQRLYQVEVDSVKIINVSSKKTTRGGRYQGTIPGYKKAIVGIHEGEAIDLFRE